jgi:hypothetical protein
MPILLVWRGPCTVPGPGAENPLRTDLPADLDKALHPG